MKNDWRWRQGRDDDAKSDEQRIHDGNRGIVKSVEWTVHSGEQSSRDLRLSAREPQGLPEASPKHII